MLYTFYWSDGTKETLKGATVGEALTDNGHSVSEIMNASQVMPGYDESYVWDCTDWRTRDLIVRR